MDNFLSTYHLNTALAGNLNNKVYAEEFKIQSKEDELLKEQTDAFESFLIKEVLDISLKSQNSLFGKDASDEIYSSMYNDTMSKALSGGLGFSKLLFDFLKERG